MIVLGDVKTLHTFGEFK